MVTATRFNPETVTLMKTALDDAWNSLEPETQATVLKTTLAVRILESTSDGVQDNAGRTHLRVRKRGERDHERLRDAALRALPHSASILRAFFHRRVRRSR